jgi:hypothetical protein
MYHILPLAQWSYHLKAPEDKDKTIELKPDFRSFSDW